MLIRIDNVLQSTKIVCIFIALVENEWRYIFIIIYITIIIAFLFIFYSKIQKKYFFVNVIVL